MASNSGLQRSALVSLLNKVIRPRAVSRADWCRDRFPAPLLKLRVRGSCRPDSDVRP
jgi:hypothetical protein